MQEELSDPPLKQSIKLPCEKCPQYTRRIGASLSLMTKGHREESEQTGLAKIPPVYYTYLCPNNFPTTFYSLSNLI